jgi:hypothetical protein
MKVKLTSFYGDNMPGDEIDVDDKQGQAMLDNGGAVPAAPAKPKALKEK